jgi:hypothetical protein
LRKQTSPVAHIDEDVEIAVGPGVTPDDRSKHARVPRAMARRDAVDLVTASA